MHNYATQFMLLYIYPEKVQVHATVACVAQGDVDPVICSAILPMFISKMQKSGANSMENSRESGKLLTTRRVVRIRSPAGKGSTPPSRSCWRRHSSGTAHWKRANV